MIAGGKATTAVVTGETLTAAALPTGRSGRREPTVGYFPEARHRGGRHVKAWIPVRRDPGRIFLGKNRGTANLVSTVDRCKHKRPYPASYRDSSVLGPVNTI